MRIAVSGRLQLVGDGRDEVGAALGELHRHRDHAVDRQQARGAHHDQQAHQGVDDAGTAGAGQRVDAQAGVEGVEWLGEAVLEDGALGVRRGQRAAVEGEPGEAHQPARGQHLALEPAAERGAIDDQALAVAPGSPPAPCGTAAGDRRRRVGRPWARAAAGAARSASPPSPPAGPRRERPRRGRPQANGRGPVASRGTSPRAPGTAAAPRRRGPAPPRPRPLGAPRRRSDPRSSPRSTPCGAARPVGRRRR